MLNMIMIYNNNRHVKSEVYSNLSWRLLARLLSNDLHQANLKIIIHQQLQHTPLCNSRCKRRQTNSSTLISIQCKRLRLNLMQASISNNRWPRYCSSSLFRKKNFREIRQYC